MEIRLAELADVKPCLEIDDAYETEYVWQMEEQNHPGQVRVSFRVTHLPRPMRVTGAVSPDDVVRNFQAGGVLLVAQDLGRVRGFIDVSAEEWNQTAHINNLVISPAYRRRGVATQLVRAALDWGRREKLRAALLDTSTKDYPAICLYQKLGFAFCGFNDQFYPNRDIALFFSANLR